ncbi:hypothetical protein ACFW6S_32220 [Streptomyces sp. NPDC058740]|uniref:hypothetical protein n=1 Tax=Streptomyces sp. NPDC058740 TaxID=3346619 RepID=UPI00368268A1
MAGAVGALVAVTGSEFGIDSPGNEMSEADNGRPASLLEGAGDRVRVDGTTSRTQVTAPDGQISQIDGTDRVPGRNRGCGGIGDGPRLDGRGDNPEGRPWRGALCVDDDEVVIFRPEWGTATPPSAAGNSVDVVMNGNWTVTAIRRPAGGPIPACGRILQGIIGAGAEWLTAHAAAG